MEVTRDRDVTGNRSTRQEDDRKMPASQPPTCSNTSEVARTPVQHEHDHRNDGGEPPASSPLRPYLVDEDMHYEIFSRMACSMENLTVGIIHLVRTADVMDKAIGSTVVTFKASSKAPLSIVWLYGLDRL